MPSSVGVSWLEVVRFTVMYVEITIFKVLSWEHHWREACQKLEGISARLYNGYKNMVFKMLSGAGEKLRK